MTPRQIIRRLAASMAEAGELTFAGVGVMKEGRERIAALNRPITSEGRFAR